MQRSLLLLAVSAILFCAAVALPSRLTISEEAWLDHMLTLSEDSSELQELDESTGIHIRKRSAKDASSSSEEHKDQVKDKAKNKADSSGDSSSEEKTTPAAVEETTTEHSARKRRSTEDARIRSLCHSLNELYIEHPGRQSVYDKLYNFCKLRESRKRRQAADQKTSDESDLDAQDEKELDEQMALVEAELLKGKDNTSIEDYAQGCEVMEVSSKEANETTYAE
ncbi:uncharacterized protein LOC117137878 [Drosophila mauritiana]|uniref:Uncharacterized protein LOC117137878 n=1 Tax=Drosophila mauritiana TaxID=7226 RepID=A0A6P8JIE2_DROMA|nr:uncharacterized protein LOC117137878 [Drosophila mauritiana]